ncbi:MAG: zinc ribbon domain-containing protein [Chloroflexi bacterium]|nr:zinc ribbon domain-containing protein [Chloroflexota bacterium]
MPVYDYRCQDCGNRMSVLFRTYDIQTPSCDRCGSANVQKLVSRFYAPKSEDARLDALSDPSFYGDVDENDPKSVARFARRMADATGGDDLGPEFGEMIDQLESGEMPEDMADVGAGGDGFGGDLDDL